MNNLEKKARDFYQGYGYESERVYEAKVASFMDGYDEAIQIPDDLEIVAKFYAVDNFIDLVNAQHDHIKSLQSKLPPVRDMNLRIPREG